MYKRSEMIHTIVDVKNKSASPLSIIKQEIERQCLQNPFDPSKPQKILAISTRGINFPETYKYILVEIQNTDILHLLGCGKSNFKAILMGANIPPLLLEDTIADENKMAVLRQLYTAKQNTLQP